MNTKGVEYPVKVINVRTDTERLGWMQDWYNEIGVEFERFEAIIGRDVSEISQFFSRRFGRRLSPNHFGTFGCALSHVSVWRDIADGQAEHALVLEDDAKPHGPLPKTISELGLPEDYDVCYVNSRMVPRALRDQQLTRQYLTLFDAVLARPTDQRGHGADGYILSRKGAINLLRAYHVDRYLGHVDLQMLATGMTKDQLDVLVSKKPEYGMLARIRARRSSDNTVNSWVMTPPLVSQFEQGLSARTEAMRGRVQA